MANKPNLSDSLKKLADIVRWFDGQQEVDVELGLEKVREGAKLIKLSRDRLKEIENEFEEVQQEMNKALESTSTNDDD